MTAGLKKKTGNSGGDRLEKQGADLKTLHGLKMVEKTDIAGLESREQLSWLMLKNREQLSWLFRK